MRKIMLKNEKESERLRVGDTSRGVQMRDKMAPSPHYKGKTEDLGYDTLGWKDFSARDGSFVDAY
ncbi:unnamed protein product [Thelazia callipaeda]|uniref:Conserved domain protein n=1 Tax=Thelazia callipaeda TaxID=103827 RepID=A0A0N5DAD7_THECL|nr:unnamed protein product [Thelazia callipaeda]